MELIHSEDRDEFKRQLTWNSMLPADKANLTLHEVMLPGRIVDLRLHVGFKLGSTSSVHTGAKINLDFIL